MLTTADVAHRLGVSLRRVQALIQAGRLPAVKHGRDWVIAETDLAHLTRHPPGRPVHGTPRGDGIVPQ
jgi:excisionase family DNA binding protein